MNKSNARTVTELRAQITELRTQIAALQEQLRAIPDHETRIRILESTRAKVIGAVIVISAAVSGGTWVGLIISHHH